MRKMPTEKFFINKDDGIVMCVVEYPDGTENTGIAKCSALDEFDMAFGKRLAKRRAYLKRHIPAQQERVDSLRMSLVDAEKYLQRVKQVYAQNYARLKKMKASRYSK